MKNTLVLILVGLLMFVAACSPQSPPLQTSPTQIQVVVNPSAPAVAPQPLATPPVASSGQTHQVRIAGFKFVPSELTINVGDTVMWINEDSIGHSVASADHMIHSDILGEGKSHSQVMSVPGTFSYICGPHPSMKGKIIVR